MTRECYMNDCYREAFGKSRFCARHGWNQTGIDRVEIEYVARTHRWTRFWTPERVIAAIHRWTEEHGSPPRQDDWTLSGDYWPSKSTVVARFGRWSDAMRVAGVEVRPSFRVKAAA